MTICEVSQGTVIGEETLFSQDFRYRFTTRVHSQEAKFYWLPRKYCTKSIPILTLEAIKANFDMKEKHRIEVLERMTNETNLMEIIDASKSKIFLKDSFMGVKMRKNAAKKSLNEISHDLNNEHKKISRANFQRYMPLESDNNKWTSSFNMIFPSSATNNSPGHPPTGKNDLIQNNKKESINRVEVGGIYSPFTSISPDTKVEFFPNKSTYPLNNKKTKFFQGSDSQKIDPNTYQDSEIDVLYNLDHKNMFDEPSYKKPRNYAKINKKYIKEKNVNFISQPDHSQMMLKRAKKIKEVTGTLGSFNEMADLRPGDDVAGKMNNSFNPNLMEFLSDKKANSYVQKVKDSKPKFYLNKRFNNKPSSSYIPNIAQNLKSPNYSQPEHILESTNCLPKIGDTTEYPSLVTKTNKNINQMMSDVTSLESIEEALTKTGQKMKNVQMNYYHNSNLAAPSKQDIYPQNMSMQQTAICKNYLLPYDPIGVSHVSYGEKYTKIKKPINKFGNFGKAPISTTEITNSMDLPGCKDHKEDFMDFDNKYYSSGVRDQPCYNFLKDHSKEKDSQSQKAKQQQEFIDNSLQQMSGLIIDTRTNISTTNKGVSRFDSPAQKGPKHLDSQDFE